MLTNKEKIALNWSRIDEADTRSPEEAASRLKPRVPGQRIITWPAYLDIDEDNAPEPERDPLQRLLHDIDRMEHTVAERRRAELPLFGAEPFMLGGTINELRIRYNTETEQSTVTCDGRAVYSRWPNYPNGKPDVLTARGWMPLDMLVIGETVMGIPASEMEEVKEEELELPTLFTQLDLRWKAEERRANCFMAAALWVVLLATIVMSA